MHRLLSDEEKQQLNVISGYRQNALFVLGVSLLVLWMVPHPHGGVYEFVSGNETTVGGFPQIDLLRWLAGFACWASVVTYIFMPLYVRRQWNKF